jgi:ribonuclease PH
MPEPHQQKLQGKKHAIESHERGCTADSLMEKKHEAREGKKEEEIQRIGGPEG